jgi:hypothetical protein
MLTGVTKKDRIGMIIDQMALRTMATARLIEIMSGVIEAYGKG